MRFLPRFSRGGVVQRKRSTQNRRVTLSPGVAVVPDAMLALLTPEELAAINGEPTAVISVSDARKAMEEET